jgi:ABC-type transport system substrate-binding protein
VRAEEVITTKNEQNQILIYQSAITVPTANMFFGYRPGSAFLDERVRQAFSMTQDRDLFAEVWFNTKDFEANGLPVDVYWNSSVPADEFTGWFLDPRDPDFGENAKYYQLNMEEAKKLLSAAGHADGIDYPSTYASDSYGPEYNRQFEIQEGMAAEAGFRPAPNGVIYQSDLIPNYQSTQGDFDGVGWMLRPQSSSDPIDKFAEYNFSGSGPNFIGYDVNGVGDHSGDPYVDDLIRKGKVEPDSEARVEILHDLQRYFAQKMYLLRAPSAATGFELMWPAVKNFRWFQTDRVATEIEYWWLDQSLPPEA